MNNMDGEYMKQILFVVDEKRMGGVSILLEDILSLINLDKFKIDILVLHNNGEMFKSLDPRINLIYGTSYFNTVDLTLKEVLKTKNPILIMHKIRLVFGMKTGTIKKAIIRERKKIINNNYDLEIAFKDGFTAIFTAYGDTKRKIHWLHSEYKETNPNRRYEKLFNKILPMFDEFIAVSEGVLNSFNVCYKLDKKIEVIPNLINQEKIIEMSNEVVADKPSKREIQLIVVGRLHEIKGYDRLLESLVVLKDTVLAYDVGLTIVGDGPERKKLEDYVLNNNFQDRIIFLGSKRNPHPYIKGSDLFVMSSYYEAFGLTMAEAMTLGVPVLSVLLPASHKLITHDVNGYVVENSSDGLTKGLKELIENTKKLNSFKKELGNYNYPTKDILKEIEEVLGR